MRRASVRQVCLFLVFANLFDAVGTLAALGPHAEEANPLLRPLVHRRPEIFFVLKLAVPLAVFGLSGAVLLHPRCPTWGRRILWTMLLLAAALYFVVTLKTAYVLCLVTLDLQ